MKILLVFTLYLISGPVGCFDVIGYAGGMVTILCKNQQYGMSDKYFCNKKAEQCIRVNTQNPSIHKDRVSLHESSGVLTVFYRDLSLEDSGLYECGEIGRWSHFMNLRVKTDPCRLGPKTVIGHLGETVTINCSYPEEFQTDYKSFDKLDDKYLHELIKTPDSQKGRFSISDNRRSRVISVRISDVREDDEGVYYNGVGTGGNLVSYISHFSKIHLQVSAPGSSDPGFPTIIIIPVSICVVLLLIGGLILIFYKRRYSKTRGSFSSANQPMMMGNTNEISHSASDYEEIRYTGTSPQSEATPLYYTVQQTPIHTVYALAQLPTTSDPPSTELSFVPLPRTSSDPPNTEYSIVPLPRTSSDPPNTEYSIVPLPRTSYDPPNTVYTLAQLPTIPVDLNSPGYS
ncbi:uncharacterized protein LOC103030703 isoform X2 [Astyanax mexicanus]|uniref:uncharacterized protein LOC103030703 isoform X1 n=1 Tax=Astyanax mexicanus TaxID=7994 RepID=UPI0020CB4ECC|nr:uncharacterized protein LOC103030703 isoform X1 [Astyanax mexicanus]XP_049325602.1 uncharacterized protein LOC103030703 isoform X2 [Astyanax mexicanus]